MLRSKKPWLVPLLLLVYVTAMFVYLWPRNTEYTTWEKVGTVAVAYAIIGLLYVLLRKKQKMAQQRENDLKK